MPVKISSFEIENVKRVKAVAYEPTEAGLTVIGGKNGQGKTSVLDAIAWALGGDRFAPSTPYREGSTLPPRLKVTLSNGIVVERSGKNSSLKVTDPEGKRAGQTLLNGFVEAFALNLPKFMNASGKEKADTLLRVIGVGNELYELENEEEKLYNERLAVGRIRDQKQKFSDELPEYANAPRELVSASELIRQQQEILARNGENERKRQNLGKLEQDFNAVKEQIDEYTTKLIKLKEKYQMLSIDIAAARKTVEELHDESTAELEANIRAVEETNRLVRANLDKEKAESDAQMFREQYDGLSRDIEDIRQQKYNLLNNAKLPLEGLSIEGRELTYKGYKWDNMSGSEQLKVATAVIRKLNPECGFVLLDKLEQMDRETLQAFSEWLANEGLQAIATRVSNGDECSIIIEDGYTVTQTPKPFVQKEWKKGEF